MEFKPSSYQQRINETYLDTNENIIVNAVPGSGKTTTILNLLKIKPNTSKTTFVSCFNRSIKEELAKKIGNINNIEVNTIHAKGMGLIYQNFPGKLRVDKFKHFKLFQQYLQRLEECPSHWQFVSDKERIVASFCFQDLMRLYKTHLVNSIEDLKEKGDKFGVNFSSQDIRRFEDLLPFVIKYDMDPRKMPGGKMIDFCDMVYLPAFYNYKMQQFDEIIVDELQDIGEAQRTLILKLKKPKGRLIGVGDHNQAIYSFMGADVDSFRKFEALPNTKVLPLSVSYRCGKNIIKTANEVYNNIEPFEGNEDGEVREGSYKEIQPGDFVLCRNNDPLFALYIELLKEKRKAYIKGNDFSYELHEMVKDFTDAEYLEFAKNKLNNIESNLRERKVSKPKEHPTYQFFFEKTNIIQTLWTYFGEFELMKRALKEMFAFDEENEKEVKESICLSTVHKSKGLEANRVFILKPELMPSPYAKEPWQIEQENNLIYVCYTRAKKELITITDF